MEVGGGGSGGDVAGDRGWGVFINHNLSFYNSLLFKIHFRILNKRKHGSNRTAIDKV